MKEVNPEKIKKADIVVGIPSLNEADNIAYVTKQVDEGLSFYFPRQKGVIINCDSNSPDGTGKVFLNTKTKIPKIYLSTPLSVKGKGNNFYNLFLKIKALEAKVGIVVDADLKSIIPEWIKCMLEPIIKGYDFVSPLYLRHKNDGTLTNHLCYPLIYGLLGYNIRQPIGGEFGFSRKLVEYWMGQEWSENVRNYGIDIFMTLNAIKGGFKLGQVKLGSKIHKPSAPKLGPMFLEVISFLFDFLADNKNLWAKNQRVKNLLVLAEVKHKIGCQKVVIDSEKIKKNIFSELNDNFPFIKKLLAQEVCFLIERILKEKFFQLSTKVWPQIVYDFFYLYQFDKNNKEALIKTLRALYFCRILSFAKETAQKTKDEAEELIQQQAKLFFSKRNYLINKIIGIS